MTTPTPTAFGPPLIGQTENALGAILDRELKGSGLTRRGWPILALAQGEAGAVGRPRLIERAAAALKVDAGTAGSEIDALVVAGLLVTEQSSSDAPVSLDLTAAGRELQDRVRAAVGEVTGRLWGDLPRDDVATAGRVLATVLSRANAELGYSI